MKSSDCAIQSVSFLVFNQPFAVVLAVVSLINIVVTDSLGDPSH